MGILGGIGSKTLAGPSRRRKTRSATVAEAEAKQREEEIERTSQKDQEEAAAASPSKKAKVSEEAELSKDTALAKALEAISEEQSAEEADQRSHDEQLPASAEVLVTIPDAKVHLIEEQGVTVTLASGDFTITRIVQNGSVVAVFVKVGDELQWPLAKDEPALKIKDDYYVFTLRLPVSVDDEPDEQQDKEGDVEEEEVKPDNGILNYGVVFHSDKYQEPLKELDNILESYSAFVAVPAEVIEGSMAAEELASEQQQGGAVIPKKSDYYYKQLAPNVDDYNSAIARSIASGTGEIIKGILWVSELIATQIERSGLFMQKRIKPNKKSSKISPQTMKNIQRAKKVSKMTENLASGILSGVITATGSFTSSLLKSKPVAKLFVKVFEALELAGKNVLSRSSLVTCQVVSHRYGDEAAALTKEGLSTAGHVVTTAWTISKIRTAIDPTKASKNPLFIKDAASAAAQGLKDKKRT